MYNFNDIHELQIEPTNYCNSFCGACARNINGGPLDPIVKLNHMSQDTWNKIITIENLKHIRSINFNGAFGDCCMHPYLLEFIQKLYQIKPHVNVRVMTNGGMQNTVFWSQLAAVLKKFPSHCVSFALDGLENTLHVYRRNVSYTKVIQNAKAFINAGGYAEWRMILFDHNMHQVGQSCYLAEKFNFSRFYIHASYFQKKQVVSYKQFPQQTITAPNKKIVGFFQSHYNTEFKKSTEPLLESNFDTKCPWYNERWIQIDNVGNVWPCCFTLEENLKPGAWNLDLLSTKFGKYFNHIGKKSLQNIIENDFYQKYVPQMWNVDTLCANCSPSKYNFEPNK